MIILVSVSILIALLIIVCKKSSTTVLLDKDTSSALKGIAILLVFVHHFGQLSNNVYYEHSFLGYIGVTIFLFIAGYVEQKQLQIKGIYYINWKYLLKKWCRLYISFILVTVAFAIVGRHQLSDLIYNLLHIERNWFLVVITCCYLLYYLSSKVFRDKNIIFFTAVVIVYIVFGIIFELQAVWYNTILAFSVGMLACKLENENKKKSRLKRVLPLVTIMFTIFLFCSIVRIMPYYITSTIASMCLALILMIVIESYNITNRVLCFVGGISWEFYLCQSKILYIIQKWFGENDIIWLICALICAIIVSLVVNKFSVYLGKIINEKLLKNGNNIY